MQGFGKSSMPLDATGVPIAQDAFYVVKVPSKFARNYGHFDNVVVKSENVDPVNRVVRLEASADKWIRTTWLHRVHLGPVLSLEREKLASEAVIALAKGLDSKVLSAVAGNPIRNVPRSRKRKVGMALVAAAMLVCAGTFLRGFLGGQVQPAAQSVLEASFEGQPPAPILVGFTPKHSE